MRDTGCGTGTRRPVSSVTSRYSGTGLVGGSETCATLGDPNADSAVTTTNPLRSHHRWLDCRIIFPLIGFNRLSADLSLHTKSFAHKKRAEVRQTQAMRRFK